MHESNDSFMNVSNDTMCPTTPRGFRRLSEDPKRAQARSGAHPPPPGPRVPAAHRRHRRPRTPRPPRPASHGPPGGLPRPGRQRGPQAPAAKEVGVAAPGRTSQGGSGSQCTFGPAAGQAQGGVGRPPPPHPNPGGGSWFLGQMLPLPPSAPKGFFPCGVPWWVGGGSTHAPTSHPQYRASGVPVEPSVDPCPDSQVKICDGGGGWLSAHRSQTLHRLSDEKEDMLIFV